MRLHGARRIFLTPRTGPGTRCALGQNGQTNRVPCAFAIRSTMTAQPGLPSLYSTGSGGATATLTNGRTGLVLFAVTRLAARLAVRFTGRLRRAADRVVCVARIAFALTGLALLHRPASNFSNALYLLPALDNVLVGALVVSRLLTQRREGPGRLRMIAFDLAFAAPVRMIHGIHGHAANGGFLPVPPRAPGFSVGFVLMVEVADLAHRRHALHGKLAHFAGRQLHQREITFFAQQLRRAARGTHHLPAAPGIQLEVVNHRAGRNVLELQRIARKNVRALAGGNRCAHFQSHGMQDVALLAVGVVQQRQIRAAIRVVLDRRHFRGHAELFAPEVHLAVGLLVAAAAEVAAIEYDPNR